MSLIEKATMALEELEGHGMLEAYAAHAAATVLVENWTAATRDGTDASQLIPDVDRTIEELTFFKSLITK